MPCWVCCYFTVELEGEANIQDLKIKEVRSGSLRKSKFTQRTESTPVPSGRGMLKLLVCGAVGILVSLQCESKSRDILEEDRSFPKASRYSSKKRKLMESLRQMHLRDS